MYYYVIYYIKYTNKFNQNRYNIEIKCVDNIFYHISNIFRLIYLLYGSYTKK
jgi:hypothetical protein